MKMTVTTMVTTSVTTGVTTSTTRVALVGLLALAILAVPQRARAQEDPKVVARTKLVEGGELLRKGEYREALIRFQEAYALVPSPKILYNFGLAYQGLARNADAVEAFERFLAEAADANPDQRANAERHRSTLSQQTASLTIDSDVDGAEVSVDGRSRGLTPLRHPIRLDPGPHQLVVEKAGAPPYTQKMAVEAGQKLTSEVRLARNLPAAAQAPAVVAPPAVVTPAGPAPEKPTPSHSWKWKAGIGVGVAAVAVLGYGLSQRLSANGKFNDFNNHADTGQGPGQCDGDARVLNHGGENCGDLLDAGNSAASKATIGLIVGGVLAGASAALLILTWNEKPPVKEAAASDGPRLSLRCAPVLPQPGMSCGLRF